MKKACSKGFTLVELMVVVAVLTVLTVIVIPKAFAFSERVKLTADKANVRILNSATTLYSMSLHDDAQNVFEGTETDASRIEKLIESGFLDSVPEPQVKKNVFSWLEESRLWVIFNDGEMAALSPLGSTFPQIFTNIQALIDTRFTEKGSYGRDWGDYRYTDIGLDPQDWKDPVSHIYYKPAGNLIRISPEQGYYFLVNDLAGIEKTLTYGSNWDLIYSIEAGKWYFHSINDLNEIDISSFQVKPE